MSELVRLNPLRAVLATWPMLAIAVTLSLLGILTMHPFDGASSLAPRQLIWLGLGIIVYAVCAITDMRFIRRTPVIVSGYVLVIVLLSILLVIGHTTMGAKSWFTLGTVAFQPADLAKLVVIGLLAKYFSRRHMEIRHISHIIISGIYTAAIVVLVLVQPDLGTAVILLAVWFGMVLVSGISKKHLAIVLTLGVVAAAGLWFFGLHDYQRTRIMAFVNPAADIRGAGYNAYQATVAAGSGELWGKGIGYGTQSKLRFLPEYETDFIFAAFAEEWGFAGVVLLLTLYGLLLFNLFYISRRAATNFDALFAIGVALLFLAHLAIHAGINLGLLPVTGTTIPFMSSGGSHVIMEFAALGIVASLSQHARSVPRDSAGAEYEG
ncbi:MAG TPA: FtsW/RodA/SpoVE family cell cycle protein [Candidatus Paceibacterota bacterium]|jgi:rod shape determining protein RodA|nr:FtsW/RodA/SpoVE family cell cycle protein [Candidatus Paceibacterota bacterium]